MRLSLSTMQFSGACIGGPVGGVGVERPARQGAAGSARRIRGGEARSCRAGARRIRSDGRPRPRFSSSSTPASTPFFLKLLLGRRPRPTSRPSLRRPQKAANGEAARRAVGCGRARSSSRRPAWQPHSKAARRGGCAAGGGPRPGEEQRVGVGEERRAAGHGRRRLAGWNGCLCWRRKILGERLVNCSTT